MHPSRNYLLVIIAAAITMIFLVMGCTSPDSGNNPVRAIESYLHGLVAKDANQVVVFSCAAWEEQARQELRSFDANTIRLENLQCQEIGRDGEATLVKCSGNIIANYGAEDMSIDLSRLVYKAILESGEWRMCGYQE